MKKKIFLQLFFLFVLSTLFSQTKVSGIIVDKSNQPIPFANVGFKHSTSGVVSNEEGHFYIESPKDDTLLVVSATGFSDSEIRLDKEINYNFKIQLREIQSLKEVVVFSGKKSKKNNPALDILRKIWEHKRKNGLTLFHQYQFQKYEKIEFDMNTIDSAFMKKKLFKGMEFIFKQVDTSRITGKTYLPIFINESLYDVYGDNQLKKEKSILNANKNSGLRNGDGVNIFMKDLYSEYNIYDNYLHFFDKSFTSPLSTTGIDVYNYVLKDTAKIDNKKCYNIVFYPRRKNELTFKGDFWVNDSTFAIKKINMAVTKSANINWVKDIYIEQEFEVMNDSVFLLTRDYIMSDFAFNKNEDSKGIYGKRTTLYRDHQFNKPKPLAFYKEEVNFIDNEVFTKSNEYWHENRFEKLNKDEEGIYKLIDTLKTVKRFNQIYSAASIIGKGYINFKDFEYGPVFSTFGYNEVEGFRTRVGARTFFGPNDPFRIQAYTAYGVKDNKVKYGISGKWMIDKKNRIIVSGGTRRDIEQIGASLTTSNDILGRNFASAGLFTSGSNGKLTNVNLTNASIEVEPIKNLVFETGFSYRTLLSASPSFSLDYYADDAHTISKSKVLQSELYFQIEYTPKRKTYGYGVERRDVASPYTRVFINYSEGFKDFLRSDFNYRKLQLYCRQPLLIGALGRTNLTIELGKTYGIVPLGLLNVIPGNQSYFIIGNTFSNLNYYEFVSDQYVTFQWDHNFQGRLLARIPFMRKLNWRELMGIKAVYGTISDANKTINASGFDYKAPEKPYWEYSAGIGNIFKVFRIDFSWRGNYLNSPEAAKFAVKGSFGFYF